MPKHEGMISGPVTYVEPRLNRTRDEMMAEFREEQRQRHNLPVVDYFGPTRKQDTRPEDYPWMKGR